MVAGKVGLADSYAGVKAVEKAGYAMSRFVYQSRPGAAAGGSPGLKGQLGRS